MINIRKNIFETNSSSSHTICISQYADKELERSNLDKYVEEKTLIIDLNFDSDHQYSEEDRIVCGSQYERLCYLCSLLIEEINDDYYDNIRKTANNLFSNKIVKNDDQQEVFRKLLSVMQIAKEKSNAENVIIKGDPLWASECFSSDEILSKYKSFENFIFKNYIIFEKRW